MKSITRICSKFDCDSLVYHHNAARCTDHRFSCDIDGCVGLHYSKGLCKKHSQASYYKTNKEALADYSRKWRVDNHEKLLARAKEYRTANAEAVRASIEDWRARNPTYRGDYLKAFPEKNRRWARQRRARLRKVETEPFTDFDLIALYGSDCYLCGFEIDLAAPRIPRDGEGWELGLHQEHMVSLAEGGSDTLKNVRPAHALCNLTKGIKPVSPELTQRCQDLIIKYLTEL